MALARPPGDDPRLAVALGVLLVGLTLAVFRPASEHDWLNYDDDIYVTSSPEILRGLDADSVAWAFTSFHGANWFPLTRLSWMLDVELHGLDPGGFHTTSVLLHVLCTALLYAAFLRLTGSAPKSAFVAAVFALHPLHVESVAWIAARKDPLSALFFALSLLLYERRARGGATPARDAALLACLVLGLMAKPVLVTLPFVWLLLDAWPLRRLSDPDTAALDPLRVRAAVVEKWPAFAVVAVFCVVTLLAQRTEALVSSGQLPLATRLGNALTSYAAYLGLAFAPRGLAVFYPYPVGGSSAGAVIGAAALLLAVSTAALAAWRRLPAFTVGWLWYLGVLVPMIGVVQVGSQAMADRYTYLPLLGLSIAVAWSVPALLPARRWRDPLLALAAVAAVAALSVATTAQLRHWRDSTALFERALAVTDDNFIAHAHLGSARRADGRVADAVTHWREAVRIRPDFEIAANNLAWVLATSPDPAVRHPADALTFAERAVLLTQRGEPGMLDTLAAAQAAGGHFEAAAATQQEAIDLAQQAGDAELATEMRPRLALYRARAPYTERR